MDVLCIDTTQAEQTSVALCSEEKIYAEYNIYSYKQLVKKLIPYIIRLFDDADKELNDIDCIAVTKGPGSFTGIKVGLIFAKTLAYTLSKKLIGISTLDTLAYNAISSNDIICPIIDAKKNKVYTCLYRVENTTIKKLTNEMCLEIKPLVELLKEYNSKVIFLGDGIRKYENEITTNLSNFVFLPFHLWQIRASNLCYIALERIKNNQFDDPLTLLPNYIRDVEPQRK